MGAIYASGGTSLVTNEDKRLSDFALAMYCSTPIEMEENLRGGFVRLLRRLAMFGVEYG